MKKLNYIFIINIIILGILIFHVYNDNIYISKQLKVEKQNEKKNNKKFDYLNIYLYNSIYQSAENEGISVDTNTLEWIRGKSEHFLIDFNKPILIFEYSIYSCTPCIDFIYEKLMNAFDYKLNDTRQILFLCFNSNSRIKGKIAHTINLGKKRLNISIEKEETPFLFILNKGKVENIFVPDTNFPEYTEFYLKEIKKRYSI